MNVSMSIYDCSKIAVTRQTKSSKFHPLRMYEFLETIRPIATTLRTNSAMKMMRKT